MPSTSSITVPLEAMLESSTGNAHIATPSRTPHVTPAIQRTPPKRHDFNTTQVMTERQALYPASASRGHSEATPTRRTRSTDASRSASRHKQQRSARKITARPLSPRELNTMVSSSSVYGSRTAAASTAYVPTAVPYAGAEGFYTDYGEAATRKPRPSGRGNVHGAAGTTYRVHASPHPLYTYRETGRRPQTQHPRRTPPRPPSKMTTAASPSLMISSEVNTARRLHLSTACARGAASKSSLLSTRLHTRPSVIERAASAVAASEEGRPTRSTSPPGKSVVSNVTARPMAPSPRGLTPAKADASEALAPLGLHDTLKMYLQPAPSITASSAPAGSGAQMPPQQRLPDNALVMPPPEKTNTGDASALLAQLSTLKMPEEPSANAAPVAAPTTTASPPDGAAQTATAADASTAPAPTNGGVAAPLPPPSSTHTPAPTEPATETTPATDFTGTAPAPDAAMAVPPPVASSAAALAAPVGVTHAAKKEATPQERLVHDLIAASHPGHLSQRVVRAAGPPGGLPHTSGVSSNAAAAPSHDRSEQKANFGWNLPPPNVLLPDPAQPSLSGAPTWRMLETEAAQQTQQAAAASAIAYGKREGACPAAAKDLDQSAFDTAPSSPPKPGPCVDYHAPFQAVLHPEQVEHFLAIPDISGAAVNTGVDTCFVDPSDAVELEEEHDMLQEMRRHMPQPSTQTFAAQAVALRDPLTVLASQHLAEDTIDVVARQRAYLTAMAQLSSAVHGGYSSTAALPSTPSPARRRPHTQRSVLQPASSPSDTVYCRLSYQAKVLLSAVLYMRALGALPSLLRVGPLTEYSPILEKEHCIELVFYNPSDEEVAAQASQAQQQEQRCQEMLRRSRSLDVPRTSHTQTPPDGMLTGTFDTSAYPSHGSCSVSSRRRSHSQESRRGQQQQQQLQQQQHQQQQSPLLPRQTSAVEDLLMKSLSHAAARRSGSFAPGDSKTGSPTPQQQQQHARRPGGGTGAHGSAAVSPQRLATGASFTSLAGSPLHTTTEASLLFDDATTASIQARRQQQQRASESGGAWLQRSPSPENSIACRATKQRSSSLFGGSPKPDAQEPPPPPLQERRGMECSSSIAGPIPRVRLHAFTTAQHSVPPAARVSTSPAASPFAAASVGPTSPIGASQGLGASVSINRVTAADKVLRRSSVPLLGGGAAASRRPADSANAPATAFSRGKSRFTPGERELCVVLRAVVAQKSLTFAFGKAETVHVLPPLPPPPPPTETPDFASQGSIRNNTEKDKSDARSNIMTKLESAAAPPPPATAQSVLLSHTQPGMDTSHLRRLTADFGAPMTEFVCGPDAGKTKDPSLHDAERHREKMREQARRVAAVTRRQQERQGSQSGDSSGPHRNRQGTDYGDLVVAFVWSGAASELSGAMPDMMELKALRYRIFSLHGYSSADPSNVQAACNLATSTRYSDASFPLTPTAMAPSVDPHAFRSADSTTHASTYVTSPLILERQASLQRQLSAFTAFQNSMSLSRPMSPMASIAAMEASLGALLHSASGLDRRPSFFESALRRTDPANAGDDTACDDGHYLSEFDVQQQRQQQKQQQRYAEEKRLPRRRFPLYRASSVSESTLQAFARETKAAVTAARRQAKRERQAVRASSRRSTSRVGASAYDQRSPSNAGSCTSQDILENWSRGGTTTPAAADTPLPPRPSPHQQQRGATAAAAASSSSSIGTHPAKAALQAAERELLQFRPMNLNSFHRELVDAVQYALDVQAGVAPH